MKAMVKRNATVFILLFCFGQLAAQTFEKIIHLPVGSAGVSNILLDSNDNSYFNIVSNSPSISRFGLEQNSFFLKLNAIGDSLNLLQITPNDLNPQFNNQTHDLSITLSLFENSKLSHYGSLHLDSNKYVLAKILTDQSFVVDTVILENQISDTLRNIIGKKGDFLFGSKYNLNLGIEFANIIKGTADTLNETLLFSDTKGIWNGAIEGYLNINQNNHYILATEYGGPPSYFIEGPTLSKLDSNFNLIKRERLRVPVRHQSESPNMAFANGSMLLTADSLIFTNFATVNNQDTGKGDLHLFLHDLNLTRLNYKRIVTTDTNLSSFVNCTVYDSLTSSYYVGVTQTLTIEDNHFLEQTQTWLRLFRLDKNLNLIWDKSYKRDSATIVLNRILADRYGQITMAGGYEDSITRANGNTRNIYVLRVDSNGNFIRTDLLDKIIPKRDYMVYPNPASTNLTFKKFNRFEPYRVEIFDQVGRRVGEFDWLENERSHSVENLQPGIYIYTITDKEDRTSSGKLVKTSD